MVVRKIKEENTMKETNNWGLEQEGAVVKKGLSRGDIGLRLEGKGPVAQNGEECSRQREQHVQRPRGRK